MCLYLTLRKCRNIKEMRLADVANECGISESYLSLIESGKRRPNLPMLEKISKALDIPLTIIIFLSYDRKKIKKMDSELADKFSSFIMKMLNLP